jgi:hypothetical protein
MKAMKTLAVLAVLFAVSACAGTRGTIGNQEVCMNDYLLGVISITEMVSPCSK